MLKYILILLICLPFISGCASLRYNAMKDPVYHAYLAGEITYAEYVDHYHRLMAGRRATGQAVSQGFQDAAQSLKPKPSYTVKDKYGMPVGSIEEQ